MNEASVLIVDDEHHARRNLELALQDHGDWRLAGSCDGPAKAAAILACEDVDLVLLDIRMPGQNGLDFARALRQRARPPLIAFVTAYDEYAVEAFDVFAVDYLLKPFDDARFGLLLERSRGLLDLRDRTLYGQALDNFIADQDARLAGEQSPALSFISVRSIGRIERVPVDEILWITTAGNYVELHLADRVVMHRSTMNAIEQRLPEEQFLRVHRTVVVRRADVRRLKIHGDSTYSVEIACGETLPVSERYVDSVRKELL